MHPVLVPGLCVCFLPCLSLVKALWFTSPIPMRGSLGAFVWVSLAQDLGLPLLPVLEDNSFKDGGRPWWGGQKGLGIGFGVLGSGAIAYIASVVDQRPRRGCRVS